MFRVCVYCGSSPGKGDRYLTVARELGAAIAARGYGLVYGGARVGLMGAVADAALAGGAPVNGVMPHGLVRMEVAHTGLTTLDVVDTLHDSSVLGTVLAAGIRAAATDARGDEAQLRNAFENAGRLAAHRLERYLSLLGTIASAAPLLGLLGTVVGMIEIFGAQSPTTGSNPEQLAHGISVALYNTAFGLIVAIPALVTWRHFRSLVDGYVLQMEQAAERLLPHLLPRGRR